MAVDNNLTVTISGDNSGLEKAVEKSADLLGGFGANVAKLALGFGSLAEAGTLATQAIIDGVKAVIDFIPKCIEETGHLADTFRDLHVTAGMSVADFNQYSAAIVLSGGKTEELTDLTKGMARGIKQHSQNLIDNGIAVNQDALNHMSLAEYIDKVVKVMGSYGTATEKNDLLMTAFGRNGMQFAAQLIEINKNMGEGKEISDKYSIVTQQLVKDELALAEAKGRASLAEKEFQAIVTSKTIQYQTEYENHTAQIRQEAIDQYNLNRALDSGLVKRQQILIEDKERMGADGKYFTSMVENREAEKKELDGILERLKKITEETKNSMDAGMRAGFKTGEPLATGKYKAPDAGAPKQNTFIEDTNRLNKEAIELEDKLTRAQKENVEVQLADNKAKTENDAINKRLANGELTAVQASKERIQVANNLVAAKKQINNKYREDEIKDQAKFQEEMLKGEQQHNKEVLSLELEKIKVKNSLGLISDAQALSETIVVNEQIYQADKEALNKKLQIEGLTVVETRKVLNEVQALEDKHNKEILKQNEETYLQLRKKNPMMGLRDGAKDYIKAAEDYYTQFKTAVNQTMNAAENSIAGAMKGIISGQMNLKEAMKSIWTGITSAILDCIAQMMAKWIVAAAASEIFGVTTEETANVAAGASLDTAAAESYAAYSWIPFYGLALAQAQIEAITIGFGAAKAVDKGLTAMATGGMITQPTHVLAGEAGPEIYAPKQNFIDVTKDLVASGSSMYRSIVASQAKADGYTKTSNGIIKSGKNKNSQSVVVNIQGHVIGEGVESARIIGNAFNKHMNDYNRRNG